MRIRWRPLLLLLCAVPVRAGEKPDLAPAARLLKSSQEVEVRQGVQMCAKANCVESVELLIDLLGLDAPRRLSPAHYRDIAWEGLVEITDPYARARVAKELRTNRRDEGVRQWCAELLGIYGDADAGPTLVKACGDRKIGVKRWAARSLGMLRFEPAVPVLKKRVHDPDMQLRANTIEALARIDPAGHRELFLRALREDADGGVRCALLGAVPEIWAADTETLSADALKDPDWRPRMQAVEHLAGLRTKTAVDALVGATADARPVVAFRASRALQALTGKEITDADAWKGWWAGARAAFEFPEPPKPDPDRKEEGAEEQKEPEKAPEHRTVAYGIPLVSDHVAFVLDKSLRMRDILKATNTTKDASARLELERVLSQLHGRLVFNVYLYREDVKDFRKEAVPLDEKEQKKALQFVAADTPTGAKDIWKVLEQVVGDATVDTVYLLSSGEPDVGLYVHWNRVTRHLRDLNRFHKVVVNTVVYSERQWFRDQLQKIAEATGGSYQWYE